MRKVLFNSVTDIFLLLNIDVKRNIFLSWNAGLKRVVAVSKLRQFLARVNFNWLTDWLTRPRNKFYYQFYKLSELLLFILIASAWEFIRNVTLV
jgi:hypothetical protein